jgi:hypothetical protein
MVQLKKKSSDVLVAERIAGLQQLSPVFLDENNDGAAFAEARLPADVSPADALARISNLGIANAARVMRLLLDDGDPWQDIERYEAYARLRYNFQEPKTIHDSSHLAHSVFWVLAQGHDDRLRSLVMLGLGRLRGGRTPWADPPRAGTPDRRAVALFALWLGARRLGVAADVPVRGVYEQVCSAWQDRLPLDAVSEHHIQSLVEGGSEDFLGLFELMPLEIAAIEAVRSHEGLTTELPTSHVLFTNPIGAAFVRRGPPRVLDLHADPVYRRAVEALERAGRLTGGIDPWTV